MALFRYGLQVVHMLVALYLAGCSQPLPQKSVVPSAKRTPPATRVDKKPPIRPSQYKVQKNDTLYSIGFRFGIPHQLLAKWNAIQAPYAIYTGQIIRLQPGENAIETQKSGFSSQKKLANSIDNKTVLKLYWQWPLKGSILKPYSSTQGKGIDIAGEVGQTVRAAAAGKVVYSGDGIAGYGNLLIVRHDDEFMSAYANNSRLLVTEGNDVGKGQAIAEVGSTGSQSYLHFEIRKEGNPVNPVEYLPEK